MGISTSKHLKRFCFVFSNHEGMKLQFMSDLHLERFGYKFVVPQKAPYLILAGDIGRYSDIQLYSSFLSQLHSFESVFLIPGNHEFYGTSYDQALEFTGKLERDIPNLVVLNRKRVEIGNTTILGCTLHSHIADDAKLTMDFKRINKWTVERHNEEHDKDLAWLKDTLQSIVREDPERLIVIVTHYAPCFEKTCHPDHYLNERSTCFCSDALSQVSKWEGGKNVKYWIFGHTHWNTKFNKAGTTILSNQFWGSEADGQQAWWCNLFSKHSVAATSFNVKKIIKIN